MEVEGEVEVEEGANRADHRVMLLSHPSNYSVVDWMDGWNSGIAFLPRSLAFPLTKQSLTNSITLFVLLIPLPRTIHVTP
jgi:hypothetical protein